MFLWKYQFSKKFEFTENRFFRSVCFNRKIRWFSPLKIFIFRKLIFPGELGDLKVGHFSRKSGFFGIHFAKVRKYSAKQSEVATIIVSECRPTYKLSTKKNRSKKSFFYEELSWKVLGGCTYAPPVVRGLSTCLDRNIACFWPEMLWIT